MKSSDITLRYTGERALGFVGIGSVNDYGDELIVATRQQADRLLKHYDFEEVAPVGTTEEEDDHGSSR